MDDALYFGQGRFGTYNKFPEKDNGTEKKKGVLYRMLYSIANFSMYNKSVLRYKVPTTDSL
jgi:hypothetical protein